MADKIRIGMLGAGRIGKLHARNIAFHIPEADVVVVADPYEEAAQSCAAECGIPGVFTEAERVFEDKDVDAVAICSATDQHAAQIRMAASARKHIFCEKPIALDLGQIDEALAEVERAGIKLQIGFNRRFDPGFRQARELVAAGRIGMPHLVRITSRDPELAPMDYVRVSGGIFLDMTIHDFDMARWIIGSEVEQLFVFGNVLVEPLLTEIDDVDTTVISMRYASGALGAIDNSRRAIYGYDQRLEIFGTEGCAVVGNVAPTTTVVSRADGVTADKPLYFFLERYTQSYIDEMREFVDCLQNDRTPSCTGVDGRIPVVMGMAAKQSLLQNLPVKVEL